MEYLAREETFRIAHQEGQDLVFLRSNPWLQTSLDGVIFQGQAGIARKSDGEYALYPLDAERIEPAEAAAGRIVIG